MITIRIIKSLKKLTTQLQAAGYVDKGVYQKTVKSHFFRDSDG